VGTFAARIRCQNTLAGNRSSLQSGIIPSSICQTRSKFER